MKTSIRFILIIALALVCIGFTAMMSSPPGSSSDDWPAYGHDLGGMRYSPLAQVNRENVSRLKVAWVFHTGDISDGKGQQRRSGFETTPILVDGTLYLTTPFNRVIALDPETGTQRWSANFRSHTRRSPRCPRRRQWRSLRGLWEEWASKSDRCRGISSRLVSHDLAARSD